jgi:ethanolamine utilization protein EutA
VGLDVGTTTTQLIVSEIKAENKASAFSVPEMEITGRKIRYQSPVHFTPLLSGELVDGDKLRDLVKKEYENAGITPESVDTGAVIITGETSRKENAAQVLRSLSDLAGEFVVATAGPDLESVLAAKGAGATDFSRDTGKTVLHIDIGGGTSNLALCRGGQVVATGCLNVGGRLLKFTDTGEITYVSPVLKSLIPYRVGDSITQDQGMEIANMLALALEMAASLRQKDALYQKLLTPEAKEIEVAQKVVLSFSGGVADCIEREVPWLSYGDLGPLLGIAIRNSRLCQGEYRLGSHTIRATVIGAGCHSTQLSGSTVFLQNVPLPLQNLPVAVISAGEQEREDLSSLIRQRLEALEEWGVLALPGWNAPSYDRITGLADAVSKAVGTRPCYIALQEDMAKALGHALALRLPPGTPCLCVDRVHIPAESYLDVGSPVGPAISLVVKTLILSH